MFVGDIVDANIAAATATTRQERFNVGTGTEITKITVLKLISSIAEVAGIDAADFIPDFRPERAGEVRRSCLDVSLARTELKLTDPTDLRAGLRRTLGRLKAERVTVTLRCRETSTQTTSSTHQEVREHEAHSITNCDSATYDRRNGVQCEC